MKKLSIVAAMAIVAAGFTACGNDAPKASLKSDVDSMTYAIGMAQSQGLKEYLVGRMGVDTTYMDEFIKGLNEGVNAGDNKKKAAYYAGVQIGQQVANNIIPQINHEVYGEDSTKTIPMKNFMAGFISGTTGKQGLMTMDQAQTVAQTKMQEIRVRELEKTYGDNKKEGEKFLAENAKKEGVKTLPSGVQYKVLTEGKGAIPADTSFVKVHYEGRTIDGKVFDSSYERGEPITQRCSSFIKGWIDAMTNMPEGSVWEVYIPQELAYGERETRDIKPFSMLIFKVELIEANAKR